MSNYILSRIETAKADISGDYNTFRPNYHHYFYENYPSNYIEVEVKNEQGETVKKLYNVAKRMFKEDE